MNDYLADTNIIIQILRGNADIVKLLATLTVFIDATVYSETLQGQKSNAEKLIIKNVLDNFPLIHYKANISKRAISLLDTYSNSKNLLLPDALIAACCLEYDLTLLTFNRKDFDYIAGLKILVPKFPQI